MANPRQFDSLYDQMADLLSLTQKKTIVLDEEAAQGLRMRVNDLEKAINLLRETTDKAMETTGLDSEKIRETIKNPSASETVDIREKKILERTNKLKKEIENVSRQFSKKSEAVKVEEKRVKTEGKNRKKKFKRLGGQGWLPL